MINTGTDVIRRASIEELCGHRNRALELFAQAFDLIDSAMAAWERATPSEPGKRSLDRDTAEDLVCYSRNRDDFLKRTKASIDRSVWSHLIESTGITTLMDTKARDDFRTQLTKNPPEATPDNCAATMFQLLGDSDKIFKRGLIEAFRNLDRSYKSNDAFKLAPRAVLSGARSSYGWNHYQRAHERLHDVDRVFHVLDGKPVPDRRAGIVSAIEISDRQNIRTAETEYMRAVWYLNGNLHVTFLRPDLLAKANQIIAEHYGAVIPKGAGKDNPKPHTGPVKHADNFGQFFSPAPVVDRIMELADIKERELVLEPSAGHGALALAARERGARVTCVELLSSNVAKLRELGFEVDQEDFLLKYPSMRYDKIVMNPPFANSADIRHVLHAMTFLRRGGRITALMSASIKTRTDSLAKEFRQLVLLSGGSIEDLPDGSFKESGTMVNAVLISFQVR